MDEAFRVQRLDFEALRGFSFQRDVRREKLDRKGKVVWRQGFSMRVEPLEGFFDERLLKIDGRRPTDAEVREHRKAGRFSKHYREIVTGKSENPMVDESLSLSVVLSACHYEVEGLEIVDGFASHRVAIRPHPPRVVSKSQALADAMEGTLWLSVDGLHILGWESRLVRPVRQGPVKVTEYSLALSTRPLGDVWLPREIHISTKLSIAGFPMRKRNFYLYSGFERVGEARP